MKTQAQEWFLIKKNWIEWLEELSMEERGQVLTSLFTKQLPEGLLGTLIKSHMDEFDRVNNKREEGLAKRREASKKGNEVRHNSTPSGNPLTPSLSRTKTKTKTNTGTGINTITMKETPIEKDTDIESIVSTPDKFLSREEQIKKAKLIFQ